MAWSLVTTPPAFYLIWVGLGICGAAVLYEPAFAVIAQWFHQRRGTALAIVTFAAGLASTIFLPLSDALLHSVGWRTAVFILGLFLALVTIPLHAFILRRRPADMGLIPDGTVVESARKVLPVQSTSLKRALQGRKFWLLTLGFCLASVSAAAVRLHFIPLLISVGMDASTAAFAAGTIGIMQVAGRVIFAPLDHRFSSHVIIIGIFALQSVAMAFLLMGQSPLVIGLFILIFGASQGAATLARPSILAELYGTSHYGRISSVMTIFLTLAGTSAPLGASLVYDRFGSYEPVLWSVLVFAIAATTVVFLANRRAVVAYTPINAAED
jgi:predicted MFS family arabinose efflux permease